MNLYQEFPKQSIISELRHRFTNAEIDVVRLDLVPLMSHCRNLEELYKQVGEYVRECGVPAKQNQPDRDERLETFCLKPGSPNPDCENMLLALHPVDTLRRADTVAQSGNRNSIPR